MTREERPRLTWSRLGIGVSIGLVLFGAIDAALPHSAHPVVRSPGWGRMRLTIRRSQRPPHRWCRYRTAQPNRSPRSSSRPQTPLTRHTRRATQPSELHWPSPDRAATSDVAGGLGGRRPKDDGGARLARSSRSSRFRPGGRGRHWPDGGDHHIGQTSEVPVDERVTLRPTGPAGSPNASHWVVTNVGTGS